MPETIQQFIDARIGEANDRFKGMTKRERAVMVAGDAIWQVENESIVPLSCNRYFFVSDDSQTCEVCAIGGLFAGLMDHRKIPVDEYARRGRTDCAEGLVDVFSTEELTLIECSFEGAGEGHWYWTKHDGTDGPNPRKDLKRFLYIAANIIHNHGKFVPTKDPTDARFKAIVKKYGAAKSSLKGIA